MSVLFKCKVCIYMTLPVNASLMLVLSVVVFSPWLQLELLGGWENNLRNRENSCYLSFLGLNLSMCETKGELGRMQGWVLSFFVSATNHFGKLNPSWAYLFLF